MVKSFNVVVDREVVCVVSALTKSISCGIVCSSDIRKYYHVEERFLFEQFVLEEIK